MIRTPPSPLPPELVGLRLDRPGLQFLALHGSGARGTRNAKSDWDFAFLGSPELDLEGLRLDLGRALNSDEIDLADLSAANGLLRYRVASEGRLLFESRAGLFDDFRVRAATFWFDIEPVVRPAYDRLLDSLKR